MLGEVLPEILKRLTASNASLTDAELTRIRGQVQTLSRQGLTQLRNQIEHQLPKWRKLRLRGTAVFQGAATVDKVMEALGGKGRLGRLPAIAKKSLRDIREQNVEALLSRAALHIVNGNDGLFHAINPGTDDAPEGLTVEGEDGPLDSVGQRYALLDLVSNMLRVGYSEAEIETIATEAAAKVNAASPSTAPNASAAFDAVIAAGATRVAKRAGAFAAIDGPADVGPVLKQNVARRLSQVRWIEARVTAAVPEWEAGVPAGYRDDLEALLSAADGQQVLETLDERFETVMNFAINEQIGAEGLAQLESVRFERLPAGSTHFKSDVAKQRLPADHPVRQSLLELETRLGEGERSAVGGPAYATQTFPTEVLDRVVRGEMTVVAYDGSKARGVDYIRERYGVSKDGTKLGARLMGLQGIYGSYPRTVVTLDDGRQFLLVTGYGASRQLNNAATLMLYADDQGRRIEASSIQLATDGTDLQQKLQEELITALATDWGDRQGAVDDVPTRLMILQNPAHLEQLLGDALTWGQTPQDTMVPFRIGYRTFDDGRVERVVAPKVGGGGLYGDTAGQMITAFFESGLKNLVPDVIFNGAAGGFAATSSAGGVDTVKAGLPDVEPGGLIMPIGSVEQHGDGKGPQPIPSMLGPDQAAWPKAILSAVAQTETNLTGQHVAVMAPAIETYTMIHDMVDAGHASIDVEAGAVMAATRKAGKTCTVLYTHSDDPRASQSNPNASLGMVAPFLEGSRYHVQLFDMIQALWDESAARFAPPAAD